jgi:hypothetical protein
MRISRGAAVFLLVPAIALAGQVQTYDLRWKPKPMQAFSYRMEMHSKIQNTAITFNSDLSVRILKVAANGDYTVESRFKNGKVTFSGTVEKVNDDKPEVQTFNAKGDLISEDKEDPNEDPMGYVLGQIADFAQPPQPVKIGESWTRGTKANAKKKTPAATSTFTVVGPAKIGPFNAVKVRYTFKQATATKPVNASGFFYVDARDGSMVRFEADVQNVVFDPGLAPAAAKLTLDRTN